jgi:hypothetical protein
MKSRYKIPVTLEALKELLSRELTDKNNINIPAILPENVDIINVVYDPSREIVTFYIEGGPYEVAEGAEIPNKIGS